MLTSPRRMTVTFPDTDLLEAVQPLPDGIKAGVWDLTTDPVGLDLGEVDAVILPYTNSREVISQLTRAPNLVFVQTQTTGVDGVRETVGESVTVSSASGVHAASTAELAVGLVLASLRGIDAAVRDQMERRWRPQRRRSLADRRVLLVGVGGIGREIAKRLDPFEVQLTRVATRSRDDEYGHVHGVDELTELAKTNDILIVITPLTDSTRHLVNSAVLSALPDGALVVNMARGAVVDSDALTAEVISGRLHCALDVFDPEPLPDDSPLWSSKNALITPHLGGNSTAFESRIVRLVHNQLHKLASGELPENVVQLRS